MISVSTNQMKRQSTKQYLSNTPNTEVESSPLPSFEELVPDLNIEDDTLTIDEIAHLVKQESTDEDYEDEDDDETQQIVNQQFNSEEQTETTEEEDDYDDEYEEDEIDFSPIFEDSPNFEPPEGLIEKILEREAEIEARRIPKEKRPLTIARKEAKEKHRRHESDCGSPEVQIAMAHERILHLTKHLMLHRKDKHSKRGLEALVQLRRKNLNYLYSKNPTKAVALAAELGIRFQPPGRPWERAVKYASYKNTKKTFKVTKAEKEADRKSVV